MAEIIIQEDVGKYLVSTVKLPIDHGFGEVELWYETMVFEKGNWIDVYMDRYTTEEQARVGHLQGVAAAKTMEEEDNE